MTSFPLLFDPKDKSKNYRLWESIVLALFENFKFNYEVLGTKPEPMDKKDIHPYHFLKEFNDYQAKEYYFNEKNHVHCNSFIAYGNKYTGYPMGQRTAMHHFTLETYQLIWYTPINFISNWQETFPLVFSTDHNYFMESCNNYFLTSEDYSKEQAYPILCQEHKRVFTKAYFKKADLPESLLLNNFAPNDKSSIPEETVKTLNFCLKIFHTTVLMESALRDIFTANWDYPKGKNVKGLSLYRLNILAFLYLSIHPAVTALCYGLYRNKYGVEQSHRTAFYVKDKGKNIALKDFLKLQIQSYIDHANKNPSKELITKVIAVLDLAKMFGLGYSTNQEKGTNVHRNEPQDFKPAKLAAQLKGIDFIVEHSPNSPLWRIFYDYCGEWWSKKEMDQILKGQGPDWEELKKKPRNLAVHLFHKIAAHFWQENLDKLNFPIQLKDLIQKKYKLILGD